MRKLLLSFGVGRHAELLEIARPSFQEFADKHGYELRTPSENIFYPRPPSWWKVPMMMNALSKYDEVLWVDADIVIKDTSEDVDVPPTCWQALVRHHTEEGEVPNCGFWLVRKPMADVLNKLWDMTDFLDHGWWEQSALLSLMGYDPYVRPVQNEEQTELFQNTYFLNSGWNVHLRDRPCFDKQRVLHSTMFPDQASTMREWAQA